MSALRLDKGGNAPLFVENSLTGLPGVPVEIDGVVCIQGNDSGSAKSTRNAFYPNGGCVFIGDKLTGTDLSADDVEVFYDTATDLITAGPASATVLKVGRKFCGDDKNGAVGDLRVKFVNTPHDAVEEIADPGDVGVLTIRRGTVINLVTAGAETRTLPDPIKSGVELNLSMLTDGGDCVITAATAVNVAANTIMTFSAVRQAVKLVSVQTTAGFSWTILGNDGVTLS